MLSFQVIGCSSGVPHKKLACSSYLLKHDKRRILFDCGEGASSAMARMGIDPSTIETIFITHMHPDHCMGLPLFIQANYVARRNSRLDIFVPSEAVAGMRKLFDMTYLYPLKIPFEMEVHGFTPATEFEMSGLVVRAHQTSHLARHEKHLKAAHLKNRMQCFSYIIEAAGKKIVYSGDLGSEQDLAPILEGCDLLIVERSHINLSKLGDLVQSSGVERILITHLGDRINSAEIRRLVGRIPGTKLQIAREGLTINLR